MTIRCRWKGWSLCFQGFHLTQTGIHNISLKLALDFECDLTNFGIVAASYPTATHRSNNHCGKKCVRPTAALCFYQCSQSELLLHWCNNPQGISCAKECLDGTLQVSPGSVVTMNIWKDAQIRWIVFPTKKAVRREKLYLCMVWCSVSIQIDTHWYK